MEPVSSDKVSWNIFTFCIVCVGGFGIATFLTVF